MPVSYRPAAEAAEAAKGLTFEKVWAMFQETDKQIGELSRNIGGLNNTFGKWAEEMVSAKLWEKFRAIGYTFTHCGPREFWEGDRMVVQGLAGPLYTESRRSRALTSQ